MKRLLILIAAVWACPVALADYRVEVIADGLENPWTVAFLPDGRMLVTERPGRLRVIDLNGLVSEPIKGLPEVFASEQAGLFDVLLAEDFAQSQELYISFAHGDDDANHIRIVRARFDGGQLLDVMPVFTSQPAKDGPYHYGGRMAWMRDGTLVMGTGDGFFYREVSQDLNSHWGKVIRIHHDGSVPEDNPFVHREGALPEIYSYGHRNVQAILVDPESGDVYAHEHGPRGGDELNLILPGRNYGWPLITYGRDYSWSRISPFTALPGMEQPLLHWTPSIAPAGMTLYDGELFPEWRGNFFVAALAEESVRRVVLRDRGEEAEQEVLFSELEQRIRDVRTGPDGALYLVTDESDGQLIRVAPAR